MYKSLFILFMAAALIAGAAGNASADLTVESGETFTLSANETLTVDGNLTISATGTLDASAAGTTISLSGDWTNNGTFTPGNGTVAFTGAGTSVINGSNTFYNFTCETAGKQFTFTAGSTQTISNTLTLNGQAVGTRIALRSSSSGTRWTFDLTGGAQSVDYVDVKDSNASSNDITATNFVDSGNNDNTESSPFWILGISASAITSATYDASTGTLVVTCTDLVTVAGGLNDIDASAIILAGEGGSTYTLTTTPDVDIDSVTQFTLVMSAVDKTQVNGLLNKNGTSSDSGTAYNLASVDDWNGGASVADAGANAVTVSSFASPVITGATYDASTGVFVVTGTDLVGVVGVSDIDASALTVTGSSYTLTDTADVEITSATEFTLTLSATDKINVNGILNKNGTTSDGGTTYNLASADDWNGGASVADATGNGVTVSNVSFPTITSATYNASTGVFVVTGTNLVGVSGATNDIDASTLTLTGEGSGTYTLTDTTDVEISSATEFTLTLSATDKINVNGILNKNGTTSDGGTAYNLASADDWNGGASVADATGNGVTVSNVSFPTITSAIYNASTGVFVVTGTNLVGVSGVTNDIDVSTLILTGEGSGTYTLTDTTDVEISSATEFTLTLSATDKINVNGILNKDGTTSDGGTAYNLASADDWNGGASVADATNGVTVSGFASPAITSATYDASTGVFVVTGTNLVRVSGATNDIDASALTLTGEGSGTYTLTDTADVEITSETEFTLTLSATDKSNVASLLNNDGTSSVDATLYNLASADDWNGGASTADATNGITVSNASALPTITSATYDATNGALVVTGTNLVGVGGVANDIDASTLTLTGEGSGTYTLTDTADVEISSATEFTLTLSAADKLNVNGLLNKNGTTSDSGTTYNLASADDWNGGASVADATNGVTVSGFASPAITSATYDASTGVFVVTGTNLVGVVGASDIDVSTLTVTGSSYTLTDTSDVEITSETEFTLTLSATDKRNVNGILNKDGLTSESGTSYNLTSAVNWNGGASVADAGANAVTVSNFASPAITSATYNASTGVFVVTGTNLVGVGGATNDIDASALTMTGEGSGTYTLTDTADVEITSATEFTLTLSTTDKEQVNGLLNKDGTTSDSGTTYNLASATDWDGGASVADATNGVMVSGFASPAITSATYNASTGVFVVTGTNLVGVSGATNDIDASTLTLTGEGSGTYTLTDTTDVEISSATEFTLTLSATDKEQVNGLLNKDGTTSDSGTTYNLASADDWNGGASVAEATNGVTVSGFASPAVTSATYNASTGAFVVTGTNLVGVIGATNDIDVSTLTLTGEGSGTYTLTDTTDVEISSATEFTLTLSAADKAQVNGLLNKNGTTSDGGTTYNLDSADDWNGDASIADGTNGVTVSNSSTAVLAQIGGEGDDPDTTNSVVTAAQLNSILPALTGVTGGNETAYQDYIDATPNLFSSPATQAEVQAMIDQVNADETLLANIGTDADNGDNANTGALTAAELNALTGVSGALAAKEVSYRNYIAANAAAFSSPATEAEVQSMINTVNAANLDDNDNIPDVDEDAGPNGGDSNGDGIADSEQDNVAGNLKDALEADPITVEAGAGAVISINNPVVNNNLTAIKESALAELNNSVEFPLGFIDFTITGVGVGGQTAITLYYHGLEDLTGFTFYKYSNVTNVYTEVNATNFPIGGGVTVGTAVIGGNTVATATYTVVDGGQGDEDGVANGTIVDPFAPGAPTGGIRLVKQANKQSVTVGDIITYTVTIENINAAPVPGQFIEDKIPPGFKYIRGRSILDGQPIADPVGNRTLVFDLDSVVWAIGETRTLKYQLVVGSGVTYGSDYENSVFARYDTGLVTSNVATESVSVVADPLFDLGTTLGKVFHDRNENGVQDPPYTVNGELIIEEPIGNVQIFTEDGAVITTDKDGRYHMASISPGSHLFRLDERTLPEGAYLTTDKVVIANITPGILAKINFGVKLPDGVGVLEEPFTVTQDRGAPKPRLNVSLFTPLESKHLTGFGDEIIIDGGQLKADAEFRIFTNYQLFIEKWELEIFDKDTMHVIKTFRGTKTDMLDPISWNGRDMDGRLIKANRNYNYRLTVTGVKGRQDVTGERPIKIRNPKSKFQNSNDQNSRERQKWLEEESKINNLDKQTIVVEGETIKIQSRQFTVDGIRIIKAGEIQLKVPVLESVELRARDVLGKGVQTTKNTGQSEVEIILPGGEYEIEVSTKDEGRGMKAEGRETGDDEGRWVGSPSTSYTRHIKVGDDYLFFVAMGDARMGYTFNRGDIEPVQQDDNFNTGLWAEGKLSYYLKGKVKGKYLITSSLDSERDRKELFKTLDPDKYYPVYGDGSSVNYKATDTQGILYLLIEWDRSSAQWGNYNTDFTDTEFARFSRTLYGGKAYLESVSATKFGEPDAKVVVFKARAHQRAAHNEFLGTGGSLYYLKNKDVIEGSEKVRIEIRDQINGVAMSSENMIEGEDYEMDYANGRIVFWMPVNSVSETDTIISGLLLSGNPIYVVVDYEYEVIDRYNEGTYGVRVQKSITDYVTVGATHVKEALTGEDYELQGVDATVHLGKNVKLTAEYAKSRSEALSSYISTDGGLSFTELPTAEFSKGRAYGLKGEAHLLGDKLGLSGYYKWIDNDFSTSATSSQQGKELIGFGTTYDLGTNTRLTASHDIQQQINDGNPQTRLQVGATRTETTSVQLTHKSDRLKLTAAARHQEVTKEKDEFESETNSEEDVIAAKAEYKLTDKIDVSLEQQATIKGTVNHQTTAGVEAEVFDWLSLRGREIIGSQGTATGVGATLNVKDKGSISGDYTRTASKAGKIGDNASISASGKVSDKTELHTTYAVTDSMSEDKISSFTFGSKRKINDNLTLNSDKTFASSKDNKVRGTTYGLEWEKNNRTLGGTFTREYAKGTTGGSEANIFGLTGDINDRWFASGSFERRKVQNHDGTLTTRKATSFGLGYVGKDKKTGEVKLKASSKLELRYDEGDGDDHEQYLLYSVIEGKINPDTTLFANVNLSRTRNTTTNSTDALYKELVFGTAYRPVNFDWLNLMAKYTYLKDFSPVSQSDFNDIEKEKAHTFAAEAVIDLTDKWQLTEKLAYKTGEEKVTGFDFTKTQTRLWINRLGYNLYRDWQVFGEYRILDQKQAHDQKQGALVEVARDFGEFIQAGVGYNFTDFNDDLTHLDYTSQGPFIRITAKLFDRTPEEIKRKKEQARTKKKNREKRRLLKKKISDINKEAKKLYRKKLYDKATAKFEEVLEIDANNKTALRYMKLIAQKV